MFVTGDYAMLPIDTVLNVNPDTAFVEVMLPYVGEAVGKFYSINNVGTSGNTVHVVDHGDSTGFVSPDDLTSGGASLYFSNGVQWLLVYSNV
jgi:hypothetical protein